MKKLILALIILSTLFFSAYCSYHLGSTAGYKAGYEVGYRAGYESGYTYGNETGFTQGYSVGLERGYTIGFNDGNQTGYERGYSAGYELGFSIGFENGNSTGFNLGYSLGRESGYLIGFEDGNLTGFNLGYNSGYENGYLQGVIDGAGRGFTVRDPTYEEVTVFIAMDQTDKNEYIEGVYTCINFAADLKMNALKAGYRCGLVYIEFPLGAHALVCFDTVDRGLIFIEPQTDDVMVVKVGIHYWRDNGYLCSWDDTIIRYLIIW